MENIRPLHNRVLIKRLEAQEMSGMLYIPDAAKERPSRGEVLAVGDLVEELVPGHVVVFGKYSGHDLPGNQVIMSEDDVLCILAD